MDKNSKYRFFKKLTKKYRLVILNEGTFQEKIVLKITPLLVVLIIFFIGFLILFASFGISNALKYSNSNESKQESQDIINMLSEIDSLNIEIQSKDLYVETLKIMLGGGGFRDSSLNVKNSNDLEEVVNLEKTKNDSLFRIKIEGSSYENIIHFFPPLVGTFTEKHDKNKNHFGIDLVSTEGSIINSIADGVVVINNWTQETGFVIGVQHSEGFLSFYKHNSKILKNIGDYVKSGEGIAIIGNSGELSSGPHLHFELWKNGESVNPENYIVF